MDSFQLLDDIELHEIDVNFYTIQEETKNKLFSNFIIEEINHEKQIEEQETKYPVFQIPISELKKKHIRLCNELLLELDSTKSINLDYENLVPLLKIVLNNKKSVKYLQGKYFYTYPCSTRKNLFRDLYEKIIIKKEKNFLKIDNPLSDFALSWLMSMYH
jgi:hypothetical protein